MPRITTLTFTKDYQTVAEAFARLLKNPVMTERTLLDQKVIDLEGDFTTFVLSDMDTWGGHLKFEIHDNQLVEGDQDDRESRAFLSEKMPGFGAVLWAPAFALVFRRIEVETRTRRVTEKLVGGKLTDHQERSTLYEWEEITAEWGRKVPPGPAF